MRPSSNGTSRTARAGEGGGQTIEPRVNVITLAVDDLESALVFYRDGLGLQTNGVVATDLVDEETGAAGAIAIFKLESGVILALYPRSELAKDAAVPAGQQRSGGFSLGQIVGSRADVDRILERAAAAGASVTPPHDRPWGIYSGYFRDLDGHLWEIIWNPGRASGSD
jgi:catechol 2,3-dioxygenase-like lactoylglutathione lyase family enzyme